MLSERQQRILAALIEQYVAYAMPVGSRTLSERYALGVSSATIRNDLSTLEDKGYISQPHTSAGRIPTDTGYRAFVDDLLQNELADEDSIDEQVLTQLRTQAHELDDLLARTSQALTRFTDCLSLVFPPSVLRLHLKQITLVNLTDQQVLIVVVTETGQVLNRRVDLPQAVEAEVISDIQNSFNRFFAEKNFKEAKDWVDQQAFDVFSDPIAEILLQELFLCLQENEGGHIRSLGLSSLVSQPEFAQSNTMLPLMRLLENQNVLLHILDDTEGNDETIVRIGRENAPLELEGVSIIASHYGTGSAEGVVAIIGPTRMDYSRSIKAIRAARTLLQSP